MATQEVLQVNGTQLLFADHGTDFGAAPATPANSLIIGSPVDVQMNLSIIAAAAAWQSAKTADLGAAWSGQWLLGACMESTATPAAGGTFDFWWNGSPSGTAGTGNGGNASGADAAFLVAGLPQLHFLGSLTVMAQVINIDPHIRKFWMPYRYGSLIMVNNTNVAMVADGNADECHAVLTPVIPDIQAAA